MVTWDDIIALLGDNPSLVKLKDCAVTWSGSGYKLGNINGWLGWYVKGIPESYKRVQEPSKPTGTGILDKEHIEKLYISEELKTDRQAYIAFIAGLPLEQVRYNENNPLSKAEIETLPKAHKDKYNASRNITLGYIKIYAPARHQQLCDF